MTSNFDRATIYNMECSTPQRAYMSETAFLTYVREQTPELDDDAREMVRRCYRDISPFDIMRPEAFEEARVCALEQIRARRARTRVISTATRSVAPAHRGALMASMPDRRAGAEGDEGGMD